MIAPQGLCFARAGVPRKADAFFVLFSGIRVRPTMIPRVLEPEVMDTPEEASDYDAMDHDAVNRAFVDDLLAAIPLGGRPPEHDSSEHDSSEDGGSEDDGDGFTCDILDLGTGTARIPIELCRRVDGCRVMAADLAAEMLEVARYHLEIEGLTEQIQLDQADAKNLPYADGMFDVAMSNSIVHHLPEPLTGLREAVRVVRPGGRLFFRDLSRPESEEQLQELVATYAGSANDRQRKMFADSLRAALTLDEIASLVSQLGFDRATVQATSDRHWTWSAEKPLDD